MSRIVSNSCLHKAIDRILERLKLFEGAGFDWETLLARVLGDFRFDVE